MKPKEAKAASFAACSRKRNRERQTSLVRGQHFSVSPTGTQTLTDVLAAKLGERLSLNTFVISVSETTILGWRNDISSHCSKWRGPDHDLGRSHNRRHADIGRRDTLTRSRSDDRRPAVGNRIRAHRCSFARLSKKAKSAIRSTVSAFSFRARLEFERSAASGILPFFLTAHRKVMRF